MLVVKKEMRSFLCVSVSCAVMFSCVMAESMDQLNQDFTDILMACMSDNPITAADLEAMTNKIMPDSNTAKCLFACAYKKTGMMDENGKLSLDGVRQLSNKYFGNDAAKMKTSDDFANACISVNQEPVADGGKGCDRAGMIFKCSVEKAVDFLL